MGQLIRANYLHFFRSLNFDEKIEIMAAMAIELKGSTVQNKVNARQQRLEVLEQLTGAWKNTDIDGDDIVHSRTVSSRQIEL